MLSSGAQNSLEVRTITHDEEDDYEMLVALAKIREKAPMVISPSRDEYDRLAILLRKSVRTAINRRRVHAYANTFYGDAALKWLVGMQIVQDVKDAKNALRHLIERRIILRADHTTPLFAPLLARLKPKYAEERRTAMKARYQQGETEFHVDHLYRFNASAFTTHKLLVTIVGATGLKYKTRLNVGGYLLSTKFREQVLDPYVKMELGEQSVSTSIVHASAEPTFDQTFSMMLPEFEDTDSDSLWLRVFDFHEVLDDVELGFVCIPVSLILQECTSGKVWVTTLPLAQSLVLNDHAKVTGHLQVEIEHLPYKAVNPEWTVFEAARETEFEREKRNLTSHETSGAGALGFLPVPSGLFKAIDNLGKSMTAQSKKRLVLRLTEVHSSGTRFTRPDSQVWVECSVGDRVSTSKAIMAKDMPNFSDVTITAVNPDEFAHGYLRVTLYQKYDFIKVKQGSGKVLLRRFASQPVGHVWEVPLRRTAAFKRDIKRQVGSVEFKVDIDVFEGDDDGGAENDGGADGTGSGEITVEMEDVLLSLLDARTTTADVIDADPFANVIVPDTELNCSVLRLLGLILCRKSPVFETFAKQRGFTQLVIGDWKAAGQKNATPVEAADGAPSTTAPATTAPATTAAGGSDGDLASKAAAARLQTRPSSDNDAEQKTDELNSVGGKDAPPLLREESIKKLENTPVTLLRQQSARLLEKDESAKVIAEARAAPTEQSPAEGRRALSSSAGAIPTTDIGLDDDAAAGPVRTITFIMPASSMVKALQVTETHRIVKLSRSGFVLEIEGRTPDAPFGTTFANHVQILGTAAPDSDKKCRLRISAETRFSSRPFLAGTIESGSKQGAKDTYEAYVKVLKRTLRGGKKKPGEDEADVAEEAVDERPRLQRIGLALKRAAPAVAVFLVVVVIALLIKLSMDARTLSTPRAAAAAPDEL